MADWTGPGQTAQRHGLAEEEESESDEEEDDKKGRLTSHMQLQSTRCITKQHCAATVHGCNLAAQMHTEEIESGSNEPEERERGSVGSSVQC